MKFTRLRVLGFKSFVEPTEFLIEPGLTGVVGPNGCGKSNLVEALRWVMGEASYKNMRASGMDDVIFSGSGNRPARNMAEVALVVDNADRKAPAGMNDADVIEISRRIEREAGSVYKINGRDVRARDVQLLFADASTGAHSPAMVGQGRIGELINAKPKDRRALLEEAAGISGLHNRRHEAELRLSGAEQNLSRLDDVVSELDTQLEQLKRQARQAVRYRNLSGEIRRAEATVLHLRWLGANEALAESRAALDETAKLAGVRAEEQAKAARDQAVAGAALPELRDAAARAGAALQRLVAARTALDSEESRIRERLADLDRRLAQAVEDIAREERMAADNRQILARLDEEETGLNLATGAMGERQTAAQSARSAADAALSESERALSALTEHLAEITARRGQYQRSLNETAQRLARQRKELDGVVAELAAFGSDVRASERVTECRALIETSEASVREAEMRAVEAEHAAQAARERAGAAREPVAEAERSLGRVEAEAAALIALLRSQQVEGEVPVVDSVKVAPGYEAALGAAFGDDLDAPEQTDAKAHWRGVDVAHDDPPLPAEVEALGAHVQVPAVLARRLRQTGIVARSEGARLQPGLKPGQRLVSREGDLWRWDGFVAAADSPKAAAQRLASRNRLAELEVAQAGGRAALDDARRLHGDAMTAMRTAEDAERTARDSWRQAQRALDGARADLATAEREAARLTARRSALDEAHGRLTAAVAELEAAHEQGAALLAETPDPATLSGDLAAARARVGEDRATLAEARGAVEALAREGEMRAARLQAIGRERKDWQQRVANAEQQIATLTRRREEAGAEKTEIEKLPSQIETRRQALLTEIATAEAAQALAADKLANGETALAGTDRVARAALDALAEAREARGRAEERTVAAGERVAEVAERINEVLNCTPGEAHAMAELKPDAPLPELADIEARLERYRQERERLGAVNLRAEAEANEVAERRNTLVGERDDLIAAIQRLRQGILSLNREGRERLLAAFGTVNAHFQSLFTHLFGGGTAELQLTESEDPLNAGLDILARPPGKKPQSMTLLSGGEQALTAMALIFAVFLTNPAPICVLDEVDAPLDDANVERFCNLLEEMTRQTDTRFVVITHNPITMSRMNRLFGVTMAERGVSQLVSVDLATAERFREAG